MKKTIIYMNLRLFDAPANTTTAAGMSVEMKTFYDRNLIENAEPELVHDQWAQTRNIPKNGGKTIEFRKYDQLPKAMTPLTEGVTPTGKEMNVTKIEGEAARIRTDPRIPSGAEEKHRPKRAPQAASQGVI